MASYLQWPDYLILVLFLVISLGIGVYHSLTGGRQRTTQEFIMANRHLKILPTAISLLVSFESAIVILGTTAEMYAYGAQYMLMAPIGISTGIFLAERLFVPWIYRMKLVSINEYLELRYRSKTIRIFGSVLGIIVAIIFMGVAMFGPSIALHAAVGFPLNLSIPLMAIVCVAYTALGGMRAVIWTDVFQFFIMMGGILTVMVKGLLIVGGIENLFGACGKEGRLQFVDWSFDPTVRHTVWGLILASAFGMMLVYGTQQAAVQRYSAVTTLKQARIMMLLNIPASIVMYVFLCIVGLTVTAYYAHKRCDPIANNEIYSPNQGALIGTVMSLAIVSWIGVGSLYMMQPHNTLPPVSVDGCAGNLTSVNNLVYNFTPADDFNQSHIVTNLTESNPPPIADFNKIYMLSYVWYMSLGVLLTVVFGLVASLLLKDETGDVEFDERLLISFPEMFSSWKDEEAMDTENGKTDEKPTTQEMQPLQPKSDESSVSDDIDRVQQRTKSNCNCCCCSGGRSTHGDVMTKASM